MRRGGILHPHSGFTSAVSQLQVESRGSAHIRSADPGAAAFDPLQLPRHRERPPRDGRRTEADPPHLRDAADARLRVGEFLPGEKVATDEDWLAFCREMGETVFHPTSTCSMGPVVDEKLKVKGVHSLRVIDASVMPAVPSGNINAAVIAVAEKAADLLKQRE